MCYDSKRKAIIGLFRKSFVICWVKNLDRGLEPFIDGLVSVLFDFFSGVYIYISFLKKWTLKLHYTVSIKL